MAGDRRLLDDQYATDSLAYSNKICNQGSVPNHYIDVYKPNDVVEEFQFAQESGIRLSVKNTRSANSGRHSWKGSLGIWVRNLKDISYDQNVRVNVAM